MCSIYIGNKICFNILLPNKVSMLRLPSTVPGRCRQFQYLQYILFFCRYTPVFAAVNCFAKVFHLAQYFFYFRHHIFSFCINRLSGKISQGSMQYRPIFCFIDHFAIEHGFNASFTLHSSASCNNNCNVFSVMIFLE